jgi:soluble lytic murein transglycosylase
MKLRTILASLAVVLAGSAQAQQLTQPRDDVILEMQKAFQANNQARLAQLLPLAQGHALEAWAAYWELKSRIETAPAQEFQQFFARYPGTYQEDRLRNDWLQVLGKRRDWEAFAQEYPKFRMKDDREVRCYALLVEALRDPLDVPAVSEEVRRNWLAQRDADDGCTLAAASLLGKPGSKLTAGDGWRKARQAVEANRTRAASDALEIVKAEAEPALRELMAQPNFLTSRGLLPLRAPGANWWGWR